MRLGKKGQEKDRLHDDGAGEAQTKSPSQDTTGRGTWTGEPLPSGQDSGERDRLTQAWLPRGLFPEGSAVFLLAPGGKFFQTLFPGTRGRTTGHSAATAILEDPAHDEEHDDDADDGEQRSRHMTSRA